MPLLLDRDGKLLAGHARYEACKRLGLLEVPTISLEHLDASQAQAFMLSDNRLAELSEWDDTLLAEHLKELSGILDFDIELSGFDMGEIDFRVESLNRDTHGDIDSADLLPSITPSGRPVTRPRDQWQLREHRICCVNALEKNSYIALMNDKRAAMVLSDPPYNLRNVSGRGRIRHRDFLMASGEMNEVEFTLFLSRVCSLFAQFTRDGSLHYIFIDWRHIGGLLAAGKASSNAGYSR